MSSEADDIRTHTLSVYVANKPGVLARIAQVFARRGYNIDSLVVSPSMDGRYSRMTIAAQGSLEGLEQIIKQVGKLVAVYGTTAVALFGMAQKILGFGRMLIAGLGLGTGALEEENRP